MAERRANQANIPHTVVLFLGWLGIIGLLCTAWLIHDEVDASNIAMVSGLAGTAIGGLVGILASTRTSSEPPMSVVIDQPAEDPVPTTDVAATPEA